MVLTTVFLIILLIISAFFSGAEIAFMSLSEVKVRHLVEQNRRNAKLLAKLKSDPNRLLITVLIGNNLANVASASLATTFAIDLLTQMGVASALSYGVGLTTGVMTILILIFGEIFPKTFCVHHAESVALIMSPVVKFFDLLFSPVSIVLNKIVSTTSSDYFSSKIPVITEEEVISMVTMSEEDGAIKEEERELIHNVFELDNTDVAEIMTPRLDMFALESGTTIEEALDKVKDFEFSRIPVYNERIDKIDGIVFTKDILKAALLNKKVQTLKDIAVDALFVPDSMMNNVLLETLQKKKTHIALVVDEHGGIEGLVTIEDVIEELVGEIYDETDKPEELITKMSANKYMVLGKLNVQELNDELDLEIAEEEAYDTLSGFVLAKLERIPEKGEKYEIDGKTFTVNKVEENRILEVIVEIKKEKSTKEPE